MVVSQYERKRTIDFTIDVFSAAPFQLRPIPRTLRHHARLLGAWSRAKGTAGGNARNPGYAHNPQWLVTFADATAVRVRVEASKEINVNVRLVSRSESLVYPSAQRKA